MLKGDHDLFETSQGSYKEIDLIYEKFSKDRVNWYFQNFFIPSLKAQKLPITFPTIRNLAVWRQMPLSELEEEVRKYEKEWDYWQKDWVGLKQCDQVGSLIYSKNPQTYLCNWLPAKLLNSSFNPNTKTLTIDLEYSKNAGNPSSITLYSSLKPETVLVNEKVLPTSAWEQNQKTGILTITFESQKNIKLKVIFNEQQ